MLKLANGVSKSNNGDQNLVVQRGIIKASQPNIKHPIQTLQLPLQA